MSARQVINLPVSQFNSLVNDFVWLAQGVHMCVWGVGGVACHKFNHKLHPVVSRITECKLHWMSSPLHM